VVLHGIRSHGGWYDRSARAWQHQGFQVDLLDRRGCGLNFAQRGDCQSFRRFLDDVAEWLRIESARNPHQKFILTGISWGGRLAAVFPYRAPGLIHGLILIAPGLCPARSSPISERARVFVRRFLAPRSMREIPLNNPPLFTADPHWQEFIEDDALGLRQATTRMLYNSGRLGIYQRRAVRRITVPTLCLLAGKDRIIDNSKTEAFLRERIAPDLLQFQTYPDATHTLEFESTDHPWVSDVSGWLRQRLMPIG
ncbi:MAG: alpha/beta fold hydrolase, partial [Gemmataceae bacterium]